MVRKTSNHKCSVVLMEERSSLLLELKVQMCRRRSRFAAVSIWLGTEGRSVVEYTENKKR